MVIVTASHMVQPAGKTPSGLLYLSDCDQRIALTHAPTVYLYRPASEPTTLNPAEILKESLSKVLSIFYPVAGRLQWTARCRLEVNLNSAGALFLEAESEAEIDDLGDFSPSPETRALLPSVDYNMPIQELPLLLVQLTRFSCGGLSVGLGFSHLIADGVAAAHFMSEWARIARGEPPEDLPFLDRTVLRPQEPVPPPRFCHSEFSPPPLLIGRSDDNDERKKETADAMLELSKEQIQKLKEKANDQSNNDSTCRPFTRYEAVSAHMWRCSSKARQHEVDQLTNMVASVNFRSRMDPPLPKNYFGNAVLQGVATATSGDLLSNPLAYAAGKIRDAVEKLTDEYVRSSVVFLNREPDLSKFRYSHFGVNNQESFFRGNPSIHINTWTGLSSLYNVDFGWGKEIYFGPATLGHDGRSFILPGRRRDHDDEDGSFLIALRLQVAHMGNFKKFFYEDI